MNYSFTSYSIEITTQSLNEILWIHAKDELEALLEIVDKNGGIIDSPEGRCVNPGHDIESVWFCLREAIKRDDKKNTKRALQVLNWSLERGWDKKYEGILYFVDVMGKPPQQLEWDMKLWWPHTEALYALLLAYQISGEKNIWIGIKRFMNITLIIFLTQNMMSGSDIYTEMEKFRSN